MAASLKTSTLAVAALVLAASTGPGGAVAEGRQQPINDDYALLVDESDALPLGPAKSVGQARLGPAFVRNLRRLAGLSPFDPQADERGGVQVQATFVSADTDAHVDHLPPDATGTRRSVPRGERVGFWPVGVAARDSAASSEPPSYLDLLGRAQDGGARCLPIVPHQLVAFEGSLPHRTVTNAALRLLGPFHLETLSNVGANQPTTSPTTSPTVSPTSSPTTSPTLTCPVVSDEGIPFADGGDSLGEGRLGTATGTYYETALAGGFVEMIAGEQSEAACYLACNSATLADLSAEPINHHNGGDLAGITWNDDVPAGVTTNLCVCFSRAAGTTATRQIIGGGTDATCADAYGCAYATVTTAQPTANPTESPTTSAPTTSPTANPTGSPTPNPTANPTESPTPNPTDNPTTSPTVSPTRGPTVSPTDNPTTSPTVSPTLSPTKSSSPSLGPSISSRPSSDPTAAPSTEYPFCAPRYQVGEDRYTAGSIVSDAPDKENQATEYQCNDGPTSGFCGRSGYGPHEEYGYMAWTELDRCSATAKGAKAASEEDAPELWEGKGCPIEFSESAEEYEAGEVVSVCPDTLTYCLVYRCKTDSPRPSLWCSMIGYEPGSGVAWTEAWEGPLGSCEGTISPSYVDASPTMNEWSQGGCPAEYSSEDEYASGDAVSVCDEETEVCLVYSCKMDAPRTSLWCSMAGYEPGSGAGWAEAWTLEGTCSGTLSPSAATFVGGCPKEFDTSEQYEEGDQVSMNGMALECRPWPRDQHCSQAGFEPFNEANPGAWKEAWDLLGACTGTIGPTSSPNYVKLPFLGGCPAEWQQGEGETWPYEEGDLVSKDGMVFECKPWPYANLCGQDGYEPNTNPATPDAWKMAWNTVGTCSGTIAPTGSPIIAPNSVGVCPYEWRSARTYDDGDMVKATVSTDPLRELVFRCKPWPNTPYCGQYEPTDEHGSLGWDVVGTCDETPVTATFNDITSSSPPGPIASAYQGLQWTNTTAFLDGLWGAEDGGGVGTTEWGAICASYPNEENACLNSCCCDNFDQVFYNPPTYYPNGPCVVSSGTPFTALGFTVYALMKDGVKVLVEGFDANGELQDSVQATLGNAFVPSYINLETLDFDRISRLKITSSGGTDADAFPQNSEGFTGTVDAHIVIDNVMFYT